MSNVDDSNEDKNILGLNHQEIMLFLPNTRWFNKRPWMVVPHSALILTAILKIEYNFCLLDANAMNLSEEECFQEINNISPKIFLVSGVSVEYYQQYHKAFQLAKMVNKKCITVFGGIYPTLMGEGLLKTKIWIIFLLVLQKEGLYNS